MAYQALYRKWRPQTFEQVLGQTATVRTLRRQVEEGRVAHAYLFCGCRGTGKTSMAKLMSRAINCLHPDHGDPCGQCEACRAILSETTMDVLELDAASNNSVDNIRELLEQVRYPAQLGRYKVYIIDEVHMLSTAAFNALLKTLEEPPAHVVFILATTEPQKLPATILSRVQRYDFGRIPSELMVSRMRQALEELGIEAEDEALAIVARAAEGAMRDAFSILDMCVAGAEDGRITAALTRELLGTSDREFLFSFFDLLSARDEGGVMQKVDELMRSGREPQVFLRELGAHCRALLTVRAVPGTRMRSGCDKGGGSALPGAGGGLFPGAAHEDAGPVHARRGRAALRLHPAHRTGERRPARLRASDGGKRRSAAGAHRGAGGASEAAGGGPARPRTRGGACACPRVPCRRVSCPRAQGRPQKGRAAAG